MSSWTLHNPGCGKNIWASTIIDRDDRRASILFEKYQHQKINISGLKLKGKKNNIKNT